MAARIGAVSVAARWEGASAVCAAPAAAPGERALRGAAAADAWAPLGAFSYGAPVAVAFALPSAAPARAPVEVTLHGRSAKEGTHVLRITGSLRALCLRL